ncbi:transporter [Geobacter sp. FeAm09]|uniref:transporter n=1 Tax=Geobacter sp. FeAm09 TaxID=2597769 RepID=UPI0011F042E2|nr:transporter [Geobacter sp. FeAm09]QEM69060.1 transporter [Geobacter sp. FeAm09]
MNGKIGVTLLLGLCLALPKAAWCGETDARDYIPAPDGTTLLLTYAKHITADSTYVNGKRNGDFNYTQNLGFFRLVHFKETFGIMADYQALFFFNDQHLDLGGGGKPEFSASGMGDPCFLATFWLVNNRASKTYVGFSPYFTVPLGEYSRSRTLNAGTNQWAFKEEFGIEQGIGDRFVVGIQPSVEFYTDNTDYAGSGGAKVTQSKEPLFQLQTHLSYDVTPSFFIAGDYTYQNGAATKTAGVSDANSRIDSHKAGASFNFKLTDSVQVMLQYQNTFSTKNGAAVDIFGTRLLYVF